MKNLYGAYRYSVLWGSAHATILHVSHNLKALRRNFPGAVIFPVRCVEKRDSYAKYIRLSTEPISV